MASLPAGGEMALRLLHNGIRRGKQTGMKRIILPGILLLSLLLLTGCGRRKQETVSDGVHIVVEAGEGFTVDPPYAVVDRGEPVTFFLQQQEGVQITGADDPDAVLVHETDGTLKLELDQALYSGVITLSTLRADAAISYHANDGSLQDPVRIPVSNAHLRCNTAIEGELFTREGYTLLCWNTRPDGSGDRVGLGSRIEVSAGSTLSLYAVWQPWSREELFEWEETPAGIRITGCHGRDTVICVPGKLKGREVTAIGQGAFADAVCREVILPPSVRRVELYAFAGSGLRTLTLFDNIAEISGYAVADCPDFSTLYINAAEPPCYSGTYYDTFTDKYDYLRSIRDEKKLVLFSGSSARFGYDSARLDEAFPDYAVANMGVFAYTNAVPQLELMLPLMKAGDILLVSPEFDAAKRQFCTTREMDDDFFCMAESDYDLVSLLDMRKYTGILDAFSSFLSIRRGMEKRDYGISASWFDEEGNPVGTPSYNRYGDYIVPRPDAPSDEPVYGLPVEYTVKAFPRELYLDSFNKEYRLFTDRGVNVFFTYAPRNRMALSKESTPSERARLDAWLREGLEVPVISSLEDSLYPGHLLSGTDNHLSDAGVQIRTDRIIRDLQAALKKRDLN